MVCRPPHGNPIDLSRLPWDVGSSKVAGARTPPCQSRVFLSRLHGSAGLSDKKRTALAAQMCLPRAAGVY